ncbi:glycoside hydrolase family 25 protein, partial [Piedraia hortae CBS 480.64]
VEGFDVSEYVEKVDYSAAQQYGDQKFVYIKALDGIHDPDPLFHEHWRKAGEAGLIRGAYHFVYGFQDPVVSARTFVAHGGGWTPGGRIMPGAVDIENCSTLFTEDWVRRYSDEYYRLVGRHPVINTRYNVWSDCIGNSNAFHANPLWLSNYDNGKIGPIPGGWPRYTIFQYAKWNNGSRDTPYGDKDRFYGTYTQLARWARGR